jgi:hypothetical protein
VLFTGLFVHSKQAVALPAAFMYVPAVAAQLRH